MKLEYSYLIINIASISIPFLWSFEPKVRFINYFRSVLWGILVMSLIFIPWDIVYTRLGVWGFNDSYLTGLNLFGLPVEEWLFFFCIPYSSIFTHEVLKYYIPRNPLDGKDIWITPVLVIILSLILIFNWSNYYTGFVSLSAIIVILFFQYGMKKVDMSRIYFSYLLVLVPFFIVNGILTGTGLNEPIVWYNEDHFMGIRIGTIPLEDTIYALAMLVISMGIFDLIKKKNISAH